MKENGLTFKKSRSRQYSTKTILDAGYADNLVLLENTPVQTKSPLHIYIYIYIYIYICCIL